MPKINNLCNGCEKLKRCTLSKRLYFADETERTYRNTLISSRDGFDLTLEELEDINQKVSPRIFMGQSPYHIKQSLGDDLPVSESTLRRLIDKNELDARNLDLREKVKRRPRKRSNNKEQSLPSPSKYGRFYCDYRDYIANHNVSEVQMDCMEGSISSHSAFLTIHFVMSHMQLVFVLPQHTSDCVVEVLDKIEESLGTELFQLAFPAILTDNGHEFCDIMGMERSLYGGTRTKVFFCDPNRSDQKGACEANHKLIRNIIPKGTPLPII